MKALDGQDVVFGSFKASIRDMDADFAANTDRPAGRIRTPTWRP